LLDFFADTLSAHNNESSNESNKLFLIRLIVFNGLNK
jgi:hypothetical protein